MDPIKTEDGQIVMVDPYGHTGGVPVDQIGALFNQGYRFATPDENREAYFQQEYGDQPLAAGAEGLARAGTFGLYDLGARAIGAEEGVRERARRNSGASTIGEIAGYLAPVGAGKVIGDIGGAAARAALGEATSVGGRVAAAAFRGATEGGLVGAQQTISNAALSDHPESAEAILSELGSNVLYGAGVGAPLGAAAGGLGEVFSQASSRIRARAQVVMDRAAAEDEAASARAAIGPPPQSAPIDVQAEPGVPSNSEWMRRWDEGRALPPHVPSGGPEEAAIGPAAAESPSATPAPPGGPEEATANLRAPKSPPAELEPAAAPAEPAADLEPTPTAPPAGARSPDLDYQPQGPAGNTLASGPPPALWPKIRDAYAKAMMNVSDIESRLEKVYRRDTISDLGDTISQGPARRGRPRGAESPQLQDLLKAHKRAVAELMDLQGQVDAIKAAPAPMEPTLRAAAPEPPSLSRTATMPPRPAAAIDPLAATSPLPPLPGGATAETGARRPFGMTPEDWDAWDKLRKDWFAKNEPGSPIPGEPAPTGQPTANLRGGPPAGEELPPQGALPAQAGPSLPAPGAKLPKGILGDLGAQVAGLAGFAGGGALGHPFLGAALARGAYRAVRKALNAGSVAPATMRAVTGAVQRVADGVNGIIKTAPRAGAGRPPAPQPATSVLKTISYAPGGAAQSQPTPKGDSLAKTFAARAAELGASATDPQGTQARIHGLLLALRTENPQAADAVEQAAMNRLQFLWSKLPKNTGAGTPVDGYELGGRQSDAAIHDFARYAAAAETPMRLVEELAAGRLMPQTVEATQAVYPQTFAAIRQELIQRVDEIQKLPYSQRVQLSVLFQAPLDSTMKPETVAALQASFSAPPKGPGAPSSAAAAASKTSTPEPTTAQRLSA